jgi:hypothetical protein
MSMGMGRSSRLWLLGVLAAGVVSPAAAQCLPIPDGTGGMAVHCADGQVGQLRAEPGGGVTGMIGSQAVAGSMDQFLAPGLAGGAHPPGYLNPDIAVRPKPAPSPSIAPPGVGEERPFSAYPDPEGAGLKIPRGRE